MTDHETVGHTVKRCPQPEENEFEALGGEEPSYGQADYGQGDEVEDVRQRMEHSAW